MRFMMLMIPKVYQTETEQLPSTDDVERMTRFNEEMGKAGILISLDGLYPPTTGARVAFEGGTPRVTYGPFAGTRDVVGGYWMIQTQSREEAIEWAKRVPANEGDVIEIRQVYEESESPEDVQKVIESAKAAAGRT